MNAKSIVTLLLILFVVVAGFWMFIRNPSEVHTVSPPESEIATGSDEELDLSQEAENVVADSVELPDNGVVVFYFHTNARCTTCLKFEEYTNRAMETYYSPQIDKGSVEWVIVNTDEPEHEHYLDHYELYTKAVIVSERVNGVETRWKDLKDIWTKVNNEEKFVEYIKSEVDPWLEDEEV